MELNRLLQILCWYVFTSVITIAVYGIDKRRASRGQWRLRENFLHFLELIGGWPGAVFARRYFHHKWKKKSFMVVSYAIIALHIAVLGYCIYRCL